MKKENILTIDIGTQSSRAAIVTSAGEILGITQILHDSSSPEQGWVEQRPDQWWTETCQNIKSVFEQTSVKPHSIAAIANCGQMHGPVGINKNGEITTDWVQLWCDKRCAPQVESIRANHDEVALAHQGNNPLNTAWTGFKVLWEKENKPEVYNATEFFLVPKDFINFRLTGVAATDHSEASASFIYDSQTNDYSPELADILGVNIKKFARIYKSHEVIGTVTREASILTQIPSGTPVVAGGGDLPVSMLGFGIIGDDVIADVTGTSSLLAAHLKSPMINPIIQNCRHAVDGWVSFTVLDCGGISMKWCKDMINSVSDQFSYDALIDLARLAPATSNGLFFFPYMLGERRSENVNSKGAYFGITLDHKAEHLIRAVMEGVAFAMGKDAGIFRANDRELKKLLSVGGGTRNELWNEIKSSILNLPIEISPEPEAGVKGCGLLGAAGVGLIDDPAETAIARRATSRLIKPNDHDTIAYRKAQKEFNRIYDHMLGFWT
jgi:xylulokinase